jgi:uncharacterized membrane protein
MPDIGSFHPILVHFTIALLVAGVLFRIVSLTGKWKFTSPTAATLLIAGTLFAVAATKSGDDAHGPAERIPGARPMVVEHEEWGERTRNLFLLIAAIEIAGLALPRFRKGLLIGSAAAGLAGLFFVYETGEHGGELVYSYAGGVGTRHDDANDVERLLIAGLFHQATQDRSEGRSEDAARLIGEIVRRRPDDPEAQLLHVQSLLEDRGDPQAALDALRLFESDNPRLRLRRGLFMADAYGELGFADSARATLTALQDEFPDSGSVARALEALGQ